MSLKPFFGAVIFCALSFAQGAGNISNNDKQFLAAAAQNDMAEANMCKIAQQRASRQDVKDFAQRLEQEHTGDYQHLSTLAGKFQMNIPSALDSTHQAVSNRLNSLSGPDFDQQFLQEQIRAHNDAISRYQQAANSGNQQVKNYANRMLPVLQQHLQMAQNLASGGGSANRSATETAGQGAPEGGKSTVEYATVTNYAAGKTLEVKMRGRAGRHIYDLGDVAANINGNLAPGSQVKITENVDVNGRQSITVEPAPAQQK